MRLVGALGPDGAVLWAAAHETTQASFARFVEATGYTTTAEREGGAKVWDGEAWVWERAASWRNVFPGQERPVVAVTWDDAVAFVDWLTAHEAARGALPEGHVYRLPSDAEWVHLARAGTQHTYAGTDAASELCRFANVPDQAAARAGLGRPTLPCDDGVGLGTAEVGRYAANALGLFDMTGNVWEWTATASDRNPAARRMRGGSWSGRLDALEIANVDTYPSDLRGGAIGFRVVLARPLPR